jgi:hypothetical protein
MHSIYFPNASKSDIAHLVAEYPSDPAAGSPYDTGTANEVTPQWKRLTSISGDLIFQSPRRVFVTSTSEQQPTWSYGITSKLQRLYAFADGDVDSQQKSQGNTFPGSRKYQLSGLHSLSKLIL